jgi:hypothetical protein
MILKKNKTKKNLFYYLKKFYLSKFYIHLIFYEFNNFFIKTKKERKEIEFYKLFL